MIDAGMSPFEVFGEPTPQSTPASLRMLLSSALPRPPDPETYSATSIANFNGWVQDCEGYFASSPRDFTSEEMKCHFAGRYLDRARKGVWTEHKHQKEREDPQYTPTWTEMRSRMEQCMGDLRIRQNHAYEQLKAAKQGKHTPTEFLNYLQPFWRELGETNETRMMQEYIAGLNSDIREYLVKSATYSSMNTVADAETQANIAYIHLGHIRQARREEDRNKRPHYDQSGNNQQQNSTFKPRSHKRGRGSTSTQSHSSYSSRGRGTGIGQKPYQTHPNLRCRYQLTGLRLETIKASVVHALLHRV